MVRGTATDDSLSSVSSSPPISIRRGLPDVNSLPKLLHMRQFSDQLEWSGDRCYQEVQGPMTAAVDCDFVLAHLTLPHLLPPAFISVAAGAGYQGVSIRLIPANPLTERQLPMFGASSLLAETLAQMNATGIYVNDIEVLKGRGAIL